MPITPIPLNLSGFRNISHPNITIPSGQDIITQAPIIADQMTGGKFGIGMIVGMGFILYWVLSDKTPNGDFRFGEIRAIGITSGILSIICLVMLTSRLMFNLIPLGFCFAVFMLMNFIYGLVSIKQ